MRHSLLPAALAALLISGTAAAAPLSYTTVEEKIFVDVWGNTETGHEASDYVEHEASALTYDNLLGASAFTGDADIGCGIASIGSVSQVTTLGATVIESVGGSDWSGNSTCGYASGHAVSFFLVKFTVDADTPFNLQASVDAVTSGTGKGRVRLERQLSAEGDPLELDVLFELAVTGTGLSNSLSGTLLAGVTYWLHGIADAQEAGAGSRNAVAAYNLYFDIGDGSGGGGGGGGGPTVPLPGSGLLAGTALAALAGRFGRRQREKQKQ